MGAHIAFLSYVSCAPECDIYTCMCISVCECVHVCMWVSGKGAVSERERGGGGA